MEFSERALVLQVGAFREADLWVRLLSPTRGLFSAFAFGGSRSRRRFVGCLDTFNEINVRVCSTRRGAYFSLREGVLVRGLARLRGDWSRFGLAVNCARFLQSFGVEAEGAAKAHALTLGALRLLEESDSLPRLLPLYFRVRLAFDHGYSLSGAVCGGCRRELDGRGAFFLLREGLMLCPACAAPRSGERFFLNQEDLRRLERIRDLPAEQWGLLCPEGASSRQLARMMDAFIQHHIGIVWENGRFVKQ
jgi:DNA repair protein RecO (recombination protein O)